MTDKFMEANKIHARHKKKQETHFSRVTDISPQNILIQKKTVDRLARASSAVVSLNTSSIKGAGEVSDSSREHDDCLLKWECLTV